MKLNDDEYTMEEILDKKGGHTCAVRCLKCGRITAFDKDDIIYKKAAIILLDRDPTEEQGFVKCAWCGKDMYVVKRQIVRGQEFIKFKMYTDIERG